MRSVRGVYCTTNCTRDPVSNPGEESSIYGITQYLRSLVSVYEHPIITGVRILIVSSITVHHKHTKSLFRAPRYSL